MYYNKSTICCLTEVREFFEWLLGEGINFHPEDSFANFINIETKKPSFSKEVALELDGLMAQCWAVCEKYNVDICGVACEIALPWYADED